MKYQNSHERKALIADDDESTRTVYTIALEEEGWEVNQATNGQEALEKALQWRPNLLILDYQMPKLTGDEVYRQLKLHGIKFTVVLVSSFIELDKLASSLGIVYYLHKPFSVTDFLKTINFACQNLIC